ncbi:MAG TPA: cytochrome c [Vicinamibacterales bacterium]|nr:cytochrome c [Vicinamibacterales bacterium]
MTFFRPIVGALIVGAAAAGYQLLTPEPVYSHVPITTKIVFNREIAQIFQKKCFQCHTDGNVAMALTTYKEARPWAVAIKEEILERKMPPWSAAGGYGHFANDMSLTAREISLILSWADGGAPSGVLLVDEDKQPVYVPSLTSWEQGEPDDVLKVAENVKIAAETPFKVERFEVSTGLKQRRFLRALQLKPADRRVIRYAAIYDTTRQRTWLGTWSPGNQVSTMPEGSAMPLPAGAKLTVEIGYQSQYEEGSGAAELGLYYADKPARLPAGMASTAISAAVAPGQKGERIRRELTMKTPMEIAALWPNLGPGAKSFEVTAIRADGAVEPMLWLNSYRAEWPTSYVLKEPVLLPAGTRLVMTAFYDNATDAPMQVKADLHIMGSSLSRPPATLGR